uniref:Uncharacterized protein n=1 Tax=Ananas comosus var. bracteatus TaxID=296719 RepID=A0A6V7NF02_ANACO|nr:unnamed protein product [Ananas comosus var. bracteatus]
MLSKWSAVPKPKRPKDVVKASRRIKLKEHKIPEKYLPYDENEPIICSFCGTNGHSDRSCQRFKKLEEKNSQRESCRVITISEDHSEESINRGRKSKQLAIVNEEANSAWLAYESPSQNQLERMKTRILEVGNDVKRLHLDVHSLKLNLDCVATTVKKYKLSDKDDNRAVDVSTDSKNDEGDTPANKLSNLNTELLPEAKQIKQNTFLEK